MHFKTIIESKSLPNKVTKVHRNDGCKRDRQKKIIGFSQSLSTVNG